MTINVNKMDNNLYSIQELLKSVELQQRQWASEKLNFDKKQKVEEIVDELKKLRDEAGKPSRLGLVGQVSAGKTRLLETLLGVVGGTLSDNIGAGATTGNIVEYSVKEGQGTNTLFDGWKVRLMDERRVDEIFQQYVKKVQSASLLGGTRLQEFAGRLCEIQNGRDSVSSFKYWKSLADWATDVYNDETFETQIRLLSLEMQRVAAVVSNARDWLGKEFAVTCEQALRVMKLPPTQGSLQKGLPDVPQFRSSVSIGTISPEQFAVFFPIVHKISVDVLVPSRVFEFYSQYGRSFRFVDCPGYGSSSSSIRDEALCFVELQDVDAVLVLLDSQNPGHKSDFFHQAASRWGDMVARQKTVVVLNKFDCLKINENQDTSDAFESLKASSKLIVSENEALEALKGPLQQPYLYALTNVENNDPRRVVFFSSVAFIGYRNRFDSIPLGTTQFMRDRYSSENWIGKKECEDWKIVADKMEEGSKLKALLSDFAFDGGGRRLVQTFGELLNNRGQNNQRLRIHGEIEKIKERWHTLQNEIKQFLNRTEDDTLESAQLSAEEMRQAISNFKELCETVDNRSSFLGFYKTLLSRMDDSKAKCRILAIETVACWRGWSSLFRRLEDSDFLVAINKDGVPRKTSDFVNDFISVISKITNAVLSSFEKLLNDSFDDFGEKYQGKWNDSQIVRLKQTFALVRDKLEQFPERVGCWLENPLIAEMTKLYDIGALKEELSQRFPSNVSLETFEDSVYSRYYPLQHGDKPLFFAWTEEVHRAAQTGGVVTRDQRHLMGVVQIRQAFFDAVTLFIDDLYSDVRYQLVKYLDSSNLDDFFQDVFDILNEQIVDEPTLDWAL